MSKELSRKEKAAMAWKTAKPGARIMLVFMGVFVLVLLSLLISAIMPESQPAAIGDESKSSIAGVDTSQTQTSSNTVIAETQTEQGRLVAAADRARVQFEAQQGNTALQAFVADQSDESLSPFQPKNPATQFREPPANQQPTTNQQPAATAQRQQRQSTTAQPVTTGPVLSSDQIQALEAPIGATQANPKQQAPGSADKYSLGQVAKDPLAGLSEKDYQAQMAKRKASVEGQLRATYGQMLTERQKTSKGLVPIASAQSGQQPGAGGVQGSSAAGAGALPGRNMSGGQNQPTEPPPPMLLQPGDYVVIASDFPVDSRTTREFVAKVRGGVLDDARVRCTVQDVGDFLVPNCTEMTFKGRKAPIAAMVINPNTMNGIVDQDVDNDTMLKTIALVGSKMLAAYGTNKIAQGQRVTENPITGNVNVENNLSNRDILLASTATSLGDFQGAAESYYQKSAVKTIPAGTAIMLVMTQPIPDWWGISEEAK